MQKSALEYIFLFIMIYSIDDKLYKVELPNMMNSSMTIVIKFESFLFPRDCLIQPTSLFFLWHGSSFYVIDY